MQGEFQGGYKRRFVNDYVEVTCFIQAYKVKQNVTDVINKTEDLLSKC